MSSFSSPFGSMTIHALGRFVAHPMCAPPHHAPPTDSGGGGGHSAIGQPASQPASQPHTHPHLRSLRLWRTRDATVLTTWLAVGALGVMNGVEDRDRRVPFTRALSRSIEPGSSKHPAVLPAATAEAEAAAEEELLVSYI